MRLGLQPAVLSLTTRQRPKENLVLLHRGYPVVKRGGSRMFAHHGSLASLTNDVKTFERNMLRPIGDAEKEGEGRASPACSSKARQHNEKSCNTLVPSLSRQSHFEICALSKCRVPLHQQQLAMFTKSVDYERIQFGNLRCAGEVMRMS